MALKILLLRSRLDKAKKSLEEIREKDADFEKREAEIAAAIEEMTEETSEDDRNEVEGQAEAFQKEKEKHESAKSDLENEISRIENEIQEEEKRNTPKPQTPKQEKGKGVNAMENRTKFFGMSIQERDAFFAREEVKDFLSEVRTCIKEKRALTNVGLIIPEVMLELLKQRVEETSKLISRVNLRPVSGTARQRIMGEIPEGIWMEMCDALKELSLGFNDVEVDGFKVGGFFAICNAILEDNDVNLAAEIINALGKSIGKALDKAIIYGTGTKMPLGIVTRLAQEAQPDSYPATSRAWKDLHTTNVITGAGKTGNALFKDIVLQSGVIDNDYSTGPITWMMNKKTHTKIMAESISANMNAAIVAGMNNTMPVIGGDIIELSFVPDGDIVFGYLDLYLLAQRAGTSIGQSEHVRFIDDQTVFKGTARYDGIPVISEGFAIYGLSAAPTTSGITFPTGI